MMVIAKVLDDRTAVMPGFKWFSCYKMSLNELFVFTYLYVIMCVCYIMII